MIFQGQTVVRWESRKVLLSRAQGAETEERTVSSLVLSQVCALGNPETYLDFSFLIFKVEDLG